MLCVLGSPDPSVENLAAAAVKPPQSGKALILKALRVVCKTEMRRFCVTQRAPVSVTAPARCGAFFSRTSSTPSSASNVGVSVP